MDGHELDHNNVISSPDAGEPWTAFWRWDLGWIQHTQLALNAIIFRPFHASSKIKKCARSLCMSCRHCAATPCEDPSGTEAAALAPVVIPLAGAAFWPCCCHDQNNLMSEISLTPRHHPVGGAPGRPVRFAALVARRRRGAPARGSIASYQAGNSWCQNVTGGRLSPTVWNTFFGVRQIAP